MRAQEPKVGFALPPTKPGEAVWEWCGRPAYWSRSGNSKRRWIKASLGYSAGVLLGEVTQVGDGNYVPRLLIVQQGKECVIYVGHEQTLVKDAERRVLDRMTWVAKSILDVVTYVQMCEEHG